MKALLCLTILALASFIHTAELVSPSSGSFLIGDWYSVDFNPKAIQARDTCCPYGKVTFKTVGKTVQLSATNWAGWTCWDLSLSPTTSKSFLTYSVDPATTYSTLTTKQNLFSQNTAVQLAIKNLHADTIHENNSTQHVTFEMTLGQAMSNREKCSVILSKADTEVTTDEAAKQAQTLPAKKTVSAEDLSDLDDFALFEDIFKELAQKYSIPSKFLSNDE